MSISYQTTIDSIRDFTPWQGGAQRHEILMNSDQSIIDLVDNWLTTLLDGDELWDEQGINDWLWHDLETFLDENDIEERTKEGRTYYDYTSPQMALF